MTPAADHGHTGHGHAGRVDGCVFCAILAGSAPSFQIYEDEHTLAFLDINPIVAGHTLVVPKSHTTDLHEISAEQLALTAQSAQRVGRLLTDRLECEGINLLHATGRVAWQTVFHLHLHVLPRFSDDGLILPFFDRGDAGELESMWRRITG